MMELTKQEFQNECLFSVTMSHVRSMLKKGMMRQNGLFGNNFQISSCLVNTYVWKR